MESFFGSEFFAANRAKLRTLFSGTAPIVITANGAMQRGSDLTFPFHQDSNFWYLTGIDEPDLLLVIDKDKEYLILPEGHEYRERFDGGSGAEAISQRSGVASVLHYEAGWKQLKPRLKKVKHIATLAAPPAYIKFHNFYVNPARSALIATVKEINPEIELLDLRQHLIRMRVVKQPEELQAIKTAIGVTIAAMKKVTRKLPTYRTEQEIAADLTHYFLKQNTQNAWDHIVASGANSAVIHHMTYADIKPGSMILLDIGAEVEHYASDISRTYFTKSPTKRQRDVYKAVLEVQEFAFGKLVPGATHKKYEEEVRQFLGEKLRELGLIKNVDKKSIHKYFPTYTSHSLGLDAHDVSEPEQVFAPDMVWTVEPGIYIPEEGIGVRIEDDVLITKKGNKVLTSSLPKKLMVN